MIKAYAAQEAGGKLEPFEYDPGPLEPHEVRIKVDYCGICHSDLSVLDNEWGMSLYPVVPGHEIIGTIEAVGDAVMTHYEGQTVGLGWHSAYCHTCHQCHSGDHNLCAGARPTIIARHGGFADAVVADAASVVALPEGMEKESAGPLFCGGITVFSPLLEYSVKPTARVAVIGIGGLGHLALQFLRAWGCHVTAFTSSESKKQEALELGAHAVLDSRDPAASRRAAGKFDLILSTVNVKLDWDFYINLLGPKGRLHFVGATLEPLDINAFSLISQQRSVSGSPVGSPAAIATMLKFAHQHNIKPQVEMYDMSDVNSALDRLRSGDAKYRVVLKNT